MYDLMMIIIIIIIVIIIIATIIIKVTSGLRWLASLCYLIFTVIHAGAPFLVLSYAHTTC